MRLSGKGIISNNQAEVYVEHSRKGLQGPVQWEPASQSPFPMTFRSSSNGNYWECDEIPLPFGERTVQIRIVERELFLGATDTVGRIVYVGTLAL